MTTYSAKLNDIQRNWYIIDAEDLVLGRLASEVSMILRGKRKAYYTPSMDCGDYVIIVNADKVHLTGDTKTDKKTYFWHTGHPGGIKQRTAREIMDGKFPERVLEKAVERMISRNPLGRVQLSKLFIYAGPTHPHIAQQPQVFDFKALNPKNARRK